MLSPHCSFLHIFLLWLCAAITEWPTVGCNNRPIYFMSRIVMCFLYFPHFFSKQKGFGILLPNLFWPTVRKNCSSDRENFWNSRLKAENFQNFWDHLNNLFKQWKVRTTSGNRMLFLICSWRFLRSKRLEHLLFKLEKMIGI